MSGREKTEGKSLGESVAEQGEQLAQEIEHAERTNRVPLTSRTLSDGRVAVLEKAKGRHLEKGAAMAQNPANPMSLFMGVVAAVAKIDGKAITYEDVLDMGMDDVMELIGAIGGNVRAPSQLSGISS